MPWLSTLISPLQAAAITTGTQLMYLQSIWQFHLWLAQNGITISAGADLDPTVVRYCQAEFDAGSPSYVGSRVLAAILHFWPRLGKEIAAALPQSARALRGWQKLRPPVARRPLPYMAVIAIVVRLLASHHMEAALAVWIAFRCYLRPREASALQRSQLLPPVTGSGAALESWAINLHPTHLGKASKNGYWDESLPLDGGDSDPWLLPLLSLLRGSGSDVPLWTMTHQQYVRAFKEACRDMKLDHLDACLYGLRHAGASHDWLARRRALPAIKLRGRWTSDSSLRRYQKGALAQQELSRMNPAVVRMAQQAEPSLGTLFQFPNRARELLQAHGL